MVEEHSSKDIHDMLLLRTVVAVLGERVTPPWWRTKFLTEVGLRTTARIFPRTAIAAAVNSVSVAAQVDHDKRVGVGRRYHLFRLPSGLERAIAAAMSEETFRSKVTDLVKADQETLLKELESLADKPSVPSAEGPVGLGSAKRLMGSAAIAAMAAHYRASAVDGARRFPYFEETEAGL